eukprot:CAMPEP_0184872566 /NCGR_PEP_ID=MMETSP0580-20130426/41362_1 /TAXON_ID=1118495 /ORGANISM="Dactyliosolen fragilissimus" /LENGTH=207 /DNA_ID=CAMNT_0027375385 /DNA_START=716 /DNA_END=1336 /DNA_ORIENTATION=+
MVFLFNMDMGDILDLNVGNPNQWINVPFVTGSRNSVVCRLCNTGGMHYLQCHTHFNSTRHQDKHSQLVNIKKECKRMYNCLLNRVGILHRKSHIKGLIYDFKKGKVFNDNEDQFRIFERALDKYEKLEFDIEPRVNRLNHLPWKWHVKSLMFDIVNSNNPSDDMLRAVVEALKKYEKKECISVLELAVWKTKMVDKDNIVSENDNPM